MSETTVIVFVLLVIGLLAFVALSMRKDYLGSEIESMHPQGYGVSMGMSIGAGFGVALGIVFDSLGLGIAIGVAIGAALGGAWEQRNKDNVRPLTEQEKKVQRWAIAIGIVILLIGVGVFTALLLLRGR